MTPVNGKAICKEEYMNKLSAEEKEHIQAHINFLEQNSGSTPEEKAHISMVIGWYKAELAAGQIDPECKAFIESNGQVVA